MSSRDNRHAPGNPGSASSFTVECKIHFKNGKRGCKRLRQGEAPPPIPVEPGNVPRIARLMALAIRFDDLMSRGKVKSYSDLARFGHVSHARITQIMNLLHLAPDIQEEILFLPRTMKGSDPITERHVRPITAEIDWAKQRKMGRDLKDSNQ